MNEKGISLKILKDVTFKSFFFSRCTSVTQTKKDNFFF